VEEVNMKCVICGKEISQDDRFCSKCGYYNKEYVGEDALEPGDDFYEQPYYKYHLPKKDSGLKTPAKVFMIIGLVVNSILALIGSSYLMMIITLGIAMPMTVVYFCKVSYKEKVSITFKIFSMLFVSLIAGILMVADRD
jgi:hypothetical protein